MISGFSQVMSFTVITWNPSQSVHVERRIISHSAEKNRRYQDHKHILGCEAGENIDDY